MKKAKKSTRINREIKRIYAILGTDAGKVKLSKGLIEDAAFMRVELDDLKDKLKEDGWEEEYQNGANQHGIKKSVANETYTNVMKLYLTTMKQLCDIAPEGTATDELLDFVNANRRAQ